MAEYLGIDIGGTAVKWALVTDDFNIIERDEVPTDFSSSAEVLAALEGLAAPLLGRIAAVGMSVPGSVFDDDPDGTVHRGGALPYMNGVPLARELRERLHRPVSVYNDGKSCALGEYEVGALRGARVGVALAIGTGIGGGIVIEGRVLNGPHAFAGELSFLRNDVDEPISLGNLFAGTSGWTGLRRAVLAEKGLLDDPAYKDVDGRTLFEWINAGDEAARRGLDAYARCFAAWLVNLQAVLDPDVFAIGGGISRQPALIEALARQAEAEAAVFQAMLGGFPTPKVVQAELGNDANLYGAVSRAKALLAQ